MNKRQRKKRDKQLQRRPECNGIWFLDRSGVRLVGGSYPRLWWEVPTGERIESMFTDGGIVFVTTNNSRYALDNNGQLIERQPKNQ